MTIDEFWVLHIGHPPSSARERALFALLVSAWTAAERNGSSLPGMLEADDVRKYLEADSSRR
jgi:hypothetical protein